MRSLAAVAIFLCVVSSGPPEKSRGWTNYVNGVETEAEVAALRKSVARGTPEEDGKVECPLCFPDGAAISPRDRVIGLEVKSGSASRTSSQQAFDRALKNSGQETLTSVGRNAGLDVRRAIVIERP